MSNLLPTAPELALIAYVIVVVVLAHNLRRWGDRVGGVLERLLGGRR